jgi:hypothetical protein
MLAMLGVRTGSSADEVYPPGPVQFHEVAVSAVEESCNDVVPSQKGAFDDAVITGLVPIVTWNEQLDAPQELVAVQVTVVVPLGKVEPDTGVQTIVGVVPVAVGLVQATTLLLQTVVSKGHALIMGATQLPITVMSKSLASPCTLNEEVGLHGLTTTGSKRLITLIRVRPVSAVIGIVTEGTLIVVAPPYD